MRKRLPRFLKKKKKSLLLLKSHKILALLENKNRDKKAILKSGELKMMKVISHSLKEAQVS